MPIAHAAQPCPVVCFMATQCYCGAAALVCSSRTGESEVGGLGVEGRPAVHSEFMAILTTL